MTTTEIRLDQIKRHGRVIMYGDGLTATEGSDGLPTLTLRRNGKQVKFYRGSSLVFGNPLDEEDRRYLASLADGC